MSHKITYIETLIIILLLMLTTFLLFDNKNSNKINNTLKDELYTIRNELDELKKEKNRVQAEANKWYENYIELGIQCGANE